MILRAALQIVALLFPWPLRRWVLKTVYGFDIAPGARIGLSLVLVSELVMASGSRIGSLTVVKGLKRLEMGEHSRLGNLNWVTGFPAGSTRHFLLELGREPRLEIGEHAAITHRHLIDCTDAVTIGRFTTVAGWGTQVLTHAIDLDKNRQSCAPVHIGEYCFVGTRSVLLKGARLPDRSVLAAGAVMAAPLLEADRVYGGVPAKEIAKTSPDAAYFRRPTGRVE